jgi:hypothetical protein
MLGISLTLTFPLILRGTTVIESGRCARKERHLVTWSLFLQMLGEKFYACLLLLVAMSICSFADLRSFAGTTYPTFQDACLARGLLADNVTLC